MGKPAVKTSWHSGCHAW